MNNDELITFTELCEQLLSKKDDQTYWCDVNEDRNNELLRLYELNYFSLAHISMTNKVHKIKLNPNSFYSYLINYYNGFSDFEQLIIEKVHSLVPKSHYSSNEIATELNIKPIIVNTVIYEMYKDNPDKCNFSPLNGYCTLHTFND